MSQLKQVIAIASGKGGVGKSTISVNLAFSLKKLGYAVGLLDADLYGPSLPRLLGTTMNEPIAHDANKKIEPIIAFGIPTLSIGYLISEASPVIWRGPIASKAIQQLFYDTQWGDLDYLIIDLPPGTSDIHLTLAQKLNIQGAIIVTTPQQVALADAKKAISMFQKVSIPIMGVIENMSYHTCEKCHHVSHIFGAEGGQHLAKESEASLLGALPLDQTMMQQSDTGHPFVLSYPNSSITAQYHEIAEKLAQTVRDKKLRRLPKVAPAS